MDYRGSHKKREILRLHSTQRRDGYTEKRERFGQPLEGRRVLEVFQKKEGKILWKRKGGGVEELERSREGDLSSGGKKEIIQEWRRWRGKKTVRRGYKSNASCGRREKLCFRGGGDIHVKSDPT